MKYLASAVLVALLSNTVVAKVGALDPVSSSAMSIDVALAEIGTSTRWDYTFEPFYAVPADRVSNSKMEQFNEHIDAINAKINADMVALVDKTIASSLIQ